MRCNRNGMNLRYDLAMPLCFCVKHLCFYTNILLLRQSNCCENRNSGEFNFTVELVYCSNGTIAWNEGRSSIQQDNKTNFMNMQPLHTHLNLQIFTPFYLYDRIVFITRFTRLSVKF